MYLMLAAAPAWLMAPLEFLTSPLVAPLVLGGFCWLAVRLIRREAGHLAKSPFFAEHADRLRFLETAEHFALTLVEGLEIELRPQFAADGVKLDAAGRAAMRAAAMRDLRAALTAFGWGKVAELLPDAWYAGRVDAAVGAMKLGAISSAIALRGGDDEP